MATAALKEDMFDPRDLLSQLTQHTVQYHGGILQDTEVRAGIRSVLRQRSDDVEYVELGRLSVPRCTNTLSLYLFLMVDALVYNSSLYALRWWWARRKPNWEPPLKTGPQWGALVVTMVLVTVFFKALHRQVPWIEEPHALLTMCINAYMLVYQSNL